MSAYALCNNKHYKYSNQNLVTQVSFYLGPKQAFGDISPCLRTFWDQPT